MAKPRLAGLMRLFELLKVALVTHVVFTKSDVARCVQVATQKVKYCGLWKNEGQDLWSEVDVNPRFENNDRQKRVFTYNRSGKYISIQVLKLLISKSVVG